MSNPISAPAEALLALENLTVSFETDDTRLKALDNVSLSIPKGKTLCLVGESGCGKSVTAKAILRVLDENARIDAGQMQFGLKDGEVKDLAAIDNRSEEMRKIRGDEIAMIYQEPMTALSPLYTIGNQIIEALSWHTKLTKKQARAEALRVLEQVGMPAPAERIDAYTFELSGGQRQRAMIAMALVCKPRLLIADEPTTALDVTTQALILELLRDMQRAEDMSMLFITHDLGVVADIADEVAVMYMGKVVESGPVEEILTHPAHPYTRGLLASLPSMQGKRGEMLRTIPGAVPNLKNRPEGCAFAGRCAYRINGVCENIEPPLRQRTEAHEIYCHAVDESGHLPVEQDDAPQHAGVVKKPDCSGDPILRLRDVSMHFTQSRGLFAKPATIEAVNGVSFDLWPGETLGLVGESGCGKSTLGHTVIGLLEATKGSVELKTDAGYVQLVGLKRNELRKHWRDIRMVFQDPNGSFNPRLTVIDIIGEVLKISGDDPATNAQMRERVTQVMGLVGLDADFIDRYPHAFSGGQRQRIGIARALAPNPRIIIADEAVSALDVSVQAQVLNLFKELQSAFGLSYVFISHDLGVVRHISDRVAVMYAGEIVEIAPADELFASPRHPYTRALMGSVLEPVPRSMRKASMVPLSGSVPDPANRPKGCPFRARCSFASQICAQQAPSLDTVGERAALACFHPQDGAIGEQAAALETQWQA